MQTCAWVGRFHFCYFFIARRCSVAASTESPPRAGADMSDVDVPISYRSTQTGDKEHAPLEDPVLPAIAAGADCYVVKLFAAGVIDWDSFRQGPVEVDAGMMSAMAARWTVHRLNHAGAAQRAIAVFLDEVRDLVDPARLRWYRAAALLKFASCLARRRPEGWAVSAATLIGDAEMAWA